jgi:hypothetical protein
LIASRASGRGLHFWAFLVVALLAVALFPWVVYLTFTLPRHHLTPHWDVAWTGFDLGLAGSAIATAVAILRRSKLLPVAAAITGTLLLCDAWFDLLTAQPGSELTWATGQALIGELPVAAFCFWLALRPERAISN